MIRAAMSDGPPAGEVTIRRIGFVGHGCWAWAMPVIATQKNNAHKPDTHRLRA